MPSDDENDSVAIQASDRSGQYVGIDEKHGVVGALEQESLTNQDEEVDDGGWGHAFIRGSGLWSYNEFLGVSDPQEDGQLGKCRSDGRPYGRDGSAVVLRKPKYRPRFGLHSCLRYNLGNMVRQVLGDRR